MNLPTALLTIRWMARDTFRQSLASRIFWVMLIVSGVCTALCLTVSVEGVDPLPTRDYEKRERLPPEEAAKLGGADKARAEGVDVTTGEMRLLFGAVRVPLRHYRDDAVRFLQIALVSAVADTAGLLLALVWTAGFLPTFLEPHAVTVLLAKPVPRWSILVGKYVGVLVFVALQAVVFVGATWAALGLRTGVWDPLYLLSVPVLLLHFAIFFAFSTFLAVCTRSTVACVFGTILFWLLCWGMNYGRIALIAYEPEGMTRLSHVLVEAGYWILPKPADIGLILYDALRAEGFSLKFSEFKAVQDKGAFHPELSVLASLAFTVVMLVAAAYEFVTTDY